MRQVARSVHPGLKEVDVAGDDAVRNSCSYAGNYRPGSSEVTCVDVALEIDNVNPLVDEKVMKTELDLYVFTFSGHCLNLDDGSTELSIQTTHEGQDTKTVLLTFRGNDEPKQKLKAFILWRYFGERTCWGRTLKAKPKFDCEDLVKKFPNLSSCRRMADLSTDFCLW